MAPIGPQQVEVGQNWLLQIKAVGGTGPYRWRVKIGPALAIAQDGSPDCLLTWTPTLLDLAPTKAGQARAPGAAAALTVEVADAAGDVAGSSGTLQAIPAVLGP